MTESKLKTALTAALRDPKSAGEILREVSREPLGAPEEAKLVVQLLKLLPEPSDSSAMRASVALMQRAKGEEAKALLREEGGRELLRIFDEMIGVAPPDDKSGMRNDLLFLLKIVCLYAPKGGLERVVMAVRSPLLKDGYLWSVIFQVVSNDRHPWRSEIIEALREPLPEGFSAIAYLDLCNTAGRSGGLTRHPFDAEAGLALLRGWLLDTVEDRSSYAHSAAASIPFLSPSVREHVQALAKQHPDRGVQLEAAWAAAKCGDSHGFQTLEAACALPQEASAAMHYLTELGAEDRIPAQAKSDDFKAISEMCQWLAHPNEFGRPPQEIRQAAARELFWPPTDDRRKLWVFRYVYPPREGKTDPEIGYGMVGSVTFALFGESTSNLSAEQVYGLHCAWELECNGDPRAPEKRSAEAGMQILRQHNADFGSPSPSSS